MRVHTAWLVSVLAGIPGAVRDGRSQVFVSKAEYPGADAKVPLTYPYWVIHPSDGRDTADRLTGPYSTAHPRFTVWSVGLTADQAGIAAENVRAALIVNGFGVTPEIDGEVSRRVWYSSPVPIQVDTTKTPALVYHVAECGFDSDRLL